MSVGAIPVNPYHAPGYAVHQDPLAGVPSMELDMNDPDDQHLLARAENDLLLLLLDDVLTDAAAKGKSLKACSKGVEEVGIAKKIQFAEVPELESLESTDERMHELYKDRRGHAAVKRYAKTDIVDTFAEKLVDTIHSNAAITKLESTVKKKGYKVLGSIGGKLDKATSSIKKALPGSSSTDDKCTLSEKKYATIEIPECHIDWGPKFKSEQFGDALRRAHFSSLQRGYCSPATIGVTPDKVREAHRQWDVANQTDPVLWRFKTLPLRVRQAEHAIADILGVDPNDLKLCLNADQAISTIIKSLEWVCGDIILFASDVTLSTKNLLYRIAAEKGVELHEWTVPLPNSGESAVDFLKHSLEMLIGQENHRNEKLPRVKLFVFPEVGYTNGIRLHSKRVSSIFHKAGISVLCDGSLAVGQYHTERHSDWYVATLSHWMFTEPGTAVIICHPLKQITTETLTVSYFDRGSAYQKGYNPSFEKEFSYQGLQDFAPWCSIHQAVKFAVKVCGGLEVIRSYCRKLAKEVAAAVGAVWGTQPVQQNGEFGWMPVLPLPGGVGHNEATAAHMTAAFGMYAGGCPFFVHIVSLNLNGVDHLCARFSCQVYNELSEYVEAAEYIASLQPYRDLPYIECDLSWYKTLN